MQKMSSTNTNTTSGRGTLRQMRANLVRRRDFLSIFNSCPRWSFLASCLPALALSCVPACSQRGPLAFRMSNPLSSVVLLPFAAFAVVPVSCSPVCRALFPSVQAGKRTGTLKKSNLNTLTTSSREYLLRLVRWEGVLSHSVSQIVLQTVAQLLFDKEKVLKEHNDHVSASLSAPGPLFCCELSLLAGCCLCRATHCDSGLAASLCCFGSIC